MKKVRETLGTREQSKIFFFLIKCTSKLNQLVQKFYTITNIFFFLTKTYFFRTECEMQTLFYRRFLLDTILKKGH